MNQRAAQAIATIEKMKEVWESSGLNHDAAGRSIAIIRGDLTEGHAAKLRIQVLESELRALRSAQPEEKTDAGKADN